MLPSNIEYKSDSLKMPITVEVMKLLGQSLLVYKQYIYNHELSILSNKSHAFKCGVDMYALVVVHIANVYNIIHYFKFQPNLFR